MVGPPSSRGAAPAPDATARSVRPTAVQRPSMSVVLLPDLVAGYPPTDPYVRRYWIPIVGPGAVADLLRLTAAATSGRPLRCPVNLGTLTTERLAVRVAHGVIGVRSLVPALSVAQVRRLPPALRRHHPRDVATHPPTVP